MKLSPPVAVLGDATGARAAAVMVKYAAPDDVLASPPADLFEVPKLACNFADRRMHYPIHTTAAAWTSAAGYLDAGGSDPEVTGRLKQAFVYHRIPEKEWARLETKAAEGRAPTPVGRYALPQDKRYPLDTPEQVKAAAAYFQKYADRFDPATRKDYAANLLKEAGDRLSTDLRSRLEAEAGLAAPNPFWEQEFEKRSRLTDSDALKTALAKTAAEVRGSGFPDGRFKSAGELADLLRQIDRRLGWDFPDPLTGLTGETPTSAQAKLAQAVESGAGDWYATTDLDRLPDPDFARLFGGGPVVTREAKMAALRDPDKVGFMGRVLADHGVHPVSRSRPKTDWARLATG